MQRVDADDVDPRTGVIACAPPFDRPHDGTRAGRGGSVVDLLTAAGLDEVKTHADAIGPPGA